MSSNGQLVIRLDELLAGLSVALDLVEGQPLGHSGRSALIALRLADRVGVSDFDRDVLLYATLLKDAGCSSNAAHIAALFGADDREIKSGRAHLPRGQALALTRYLVRYTLPDDPPLRRARAVVRMLRDVRRQSLLVAELRCDAGAEVVGELGLPEPRPIATILRALDERWDGEGVPDGLRGEQIPLLARIVQVAQTTEVWVGAGGAGLARRELRTRAGRLLDPRLVDRFDPVFEDRSLWESLEGASWKAALRAQTTDSRVLDLGPPGIERVARVFAGIVDRKSPYTARHSQRVAALTDALAGRLAPRGRARARAPPPPRPPAGSAEATAPAPAPGRHCAARRCCTTSASSASRTQSLTRRAGCRTRSKRACAPTWCSRSRSCGRSNRCVRRPESPPDITSAWTAPATHCTCAATS